MSENNVTTKKGTTLPLMNLKGKPYMQVAHRIVWFNEEVKSYSITSEFISLTEERAVVKTTVTILDDNGKVVRSAQATKAEDRKSFADFIEKAETGSLGRAITSLGYGTAYAIADLDEGDRIIDSPVVDTRKTASSVATKSEAPKAATTPAMPAAKINVPKPFKMSAPKASSTASNNNDGI